VARYTQAVCRLCRRETMKLFLKGDRCNTEKCAVERRNYAPGQHGRRRSKIQGYGIQLREKQKVRRMYGVLERQFGLYFNRADRKKGKTGDNLLSFLERRLDNVVHRMGFASSRAQARQLVNHRHLAVNGRMVDIPSFEVRPGDVVELRAKARKNAQVLACLEAAGARGMPDWLQVDPTKFQGKVISSPTREHITLPVQEQLIVELYSK
jgi:small subunit ribosomal protein S4